MKLNNILFVFSLVAVLFVTDMATAQKKMSKIDKSPLDMAYFPRRGAKQVRVIYSRPALKGRAVFGKESKLAPLGKKWRTGANETTEIMFAQDVTFGGKKVKAGTYSLYTIPRKNKWVVILNSKLGTWGAYQHDKSKDVVRVDATVKSDANNNLENFSIRIAGKDKKASALVMGWGKTRARVSISY